MERQESIIGLTLSELAFLIVLSVIFIPLLIVDGEPNPDITQVEQIKRQNTELKEENSKLQQRVQDLEIDQLELEKLRSRLKPPCTEKKIIDGFLFTATIVGVNTYLVDGEVLNIRQLTSKFRPDLDKASEKGCVHTIRVAFSEGIDTPTYDESLRQLEKSFYPKRLAQNVTQ
ncbi:hypothetical protein MYX82_11830 [Acidobacteria bacterium AH-259-D05]|nr:hypothetical protein [Acidobacteria bacterium AH-259-D05]